MSEPTAAHATTFQVDDVAINKEVSRRETAEEALTVISRKLKIKDPVKIIGQSRRSATLRGYKTNSFVSSVQTAWSEHYPLVLSPDHFWLTIAQGFAKHVELNAESLRDKFVSHQGKEHIEVYDGEVPNLFGQHGYNWESVLGVFSTKLKEKIGPKTHALIVSDYTTTGPTELAVSEIVMMDAMKSYFTYGFITSCGFPEITLLGTAEDYRKIKRKTAALSEYGLGWWTDQLIPVLDRIIETVELGGDLSLGAGKPEEKGWATRDSGLHVPDNKSATPSLLEFWGSMFDHRGGSGRSTVTGWIINFFPYVGRNEKNTFRSVESDEFPLGISRVPFVWDRNGTKYDMEFCGGFIGDNHNPVTFSVSPEIGWAIVEVGLASTKAA